MANAQFLIWIVMLLIPLCLADRAGKSAAWAQGIEAPNPSFEDGNNAPTGWTLEGGKGQWLKDGAAEGKRAVAVSGSGSDSSYWRSAALPMKAGAVYRLRFQARNIDGRGGTVISGPPFCNVDLGHIPDKWQWYESYFITPADLRPEQAHVRLGQWHVSGSVAFDSVELMQAQPTYSVKAGLILGQGESIQGREYVFQAPLNSASRNHSRPLDTHRCGFNSDRWVFGPNSEVIYRHQVQSRKQASATVDVSVTWYAAGELLVEAGTDGKAWKELGAVGKLGGGSYPIPKELLPAAEVWIRLSGKPRKQPGKDSDTVSFQVGGYAYRATIEGEPVTGTGATHFFAVSDIDPRVKVTVQGIGEGLPGGDNVLVATVENLTDSTVEAQPVVSVASSPGETRAGEAYRAPAAKVLPKQAQTVKVPYEIPASGRWDLEFAIMGQAKFKAHTSVRVPDLFDASYGEQLPVSNEKAALWWTLSGRKISRNRPPPKATGKDILIRAARNETEAAQLVVRPAAALRGLTAKSGALAGPGGAVIPAEKVDVLRVRYVMVTHPTDATSVVAPWPDPLPPFKAAIDVPARTNQPLWVRVHVPADATPGEYTGSIRLAAEGFAADVPLRVKVYDFALPGRMTCQTSFGFSPENVWRYQKVTDPKQRRDVLDKYLADFGEHHISPYDPAPLDRFKVTWPSGKRDPESLKPTIDWTAWDAAMKRAIDEYHFNSFMAPIAGMGGGSFHQRQEPSLLGHAENTPEYQAAFTAYCQAVQEHLREKGWLKDAYVYWFDEPDEKDYEFVSNGFRRLKKAAPDLTRMLTEQVEAALVGGPNLWCPVTPNYDHQRAEERRKLGERFWWYVCCGPKAPYCTLFIDHPATELRVWLWQTWQRKIDGILVWQTNYWSSSSAYPDPNHPQDPYEDPMGWVSGYDTPRGVRNPWGNGDGRFIYPPEAAADGQQTETVLDGPVDSIRWEMLRDGVEDYEYLVILRDLLQKHKDKLPAEERKRYADLLEVPKDITADMTTFTTDPAVIEQRRDEIARAIEKLRKL